MTYRVLTVLKDRALRIEYAAMVGCCIGLLGSLIQGLLAPSWGEKADVFFWIPEIVEKSTLVLVCSLLLKERVPKIFLNTYFWYICIAMIIEEAGYNYGFTDPTELGWSDAGTLTLFIFILAARIKRIWLFNSQTKK